MALTKTQIVVKPMESWTEKEQTQAEVKVFILDQLYGKLPDPSYSPEATEQVVNVIYDYVWQRSAGGYPLASVI